MEAAESVKIIEQMLKESKKSLTKNSFYFILWAVIMIPAGIIEWYIFGQKGFWLVWPIAGTTGGIITAIYSMRKGNSSGMLTASDRVTGYTWGAFGICMLFGIFYALHLHQPPHALVLLLAGGATFISGGISKFKPFVLGGILLIGTAVICGFFTEPQYQGLVYAGGLFIGYLVPGLILRKSENG